MSTEVSQVGVVLFPSFLTFFIILRAFGQKFDNDLFASMPLPSIVISLMSQFAYKYLS